MSVLAVLVYHYYGLGGLGTAGPAPGGFMGVEVFFVISGYLITSLLLAERRRSGTVSLRRFWQRRARRLLPALFVLLAAVVTFALVFRDDLIEALKGDVLAALTYTSNWWQLALDRSYIAEAGAPALLKHLWSLAIEEQFYLFWPPLLMLALRRMPRGRVVASIVGTALASTVLMAILAPDAGPSFDPSGVYFSTFTRLSGLLLGSALAFSWTPARLTGRTGRGARVVLDAAGLVGIFILLRAFHLFHFDDPATFRGGFLLVDLATVLVIAACVHPAARIGRVLGVEPLRWIGVRSYGLYLWHYPVFAVTRPTVDNGWWGPITFVVRVGLTVALTEASFRWVETPIRKGAIGAYLRRLRDAHGAPRRRLARRGAVVVLTTSALAILLGSSLANAQPDAVEVHGIGAEEEANEAGDAPSPEALAALRGASTTTTAAARPASTTTAASTVPGDPTATTVAPTTTPPTTVPPAAPAVLGIGDSVMLGAKAELQGAVPGMVVDAVVSRQFADAIPVLQYYKDHDILPAVVVVHLGTNGRFGEGEVDTMMSVIGPDRPVYFLTARMPRTWESEVNSTLTSAVQGHANAHLVDWRQYSGCHDDWFARDGFHVTDVGAQAYAGFVLAHVTGQGATLTYC